MGYKKLLNLYSTNTWLAYEINEQYYNCIHFVWFALVIDPTDSRFEHNPPSSNPINLYGRLTQDVDRRDKHSPYIIKNRAGIINGANKKREQGVITEDQERKIIATVNDAEARDFYPLLYVIPFSKVKRMVKDVPVKNRPHALSLEGIIESLPRDYFDVIDFYNWSRI